MVTNEIWKHEGSTRRFFVDRSKWAYPPIDAYRVEYRTCGSLCEQRHIWLMRDGTEEIDDWIPSRIGFLEIDKRRGLVVSIEEGRDYGAPSDAHSVAGQAVS